MSKRSAWKHELTGQRFGRLIVLGPAGLGNGAWLTRCDCGTEKPVRSNALVSGIQVSCGCWKSEQAARNAKASGQKAGASRTRHGHAKDGMHDRAYSTWEGMKARCQNPNNIAFRRYGGAGVKVCERWQRFEHFYADMGEPPPGLTLDRINPFGNYEPGNCRWATRKEQAANKRATYAQP
jgi:hypothetical protein